MSSDPQARLAEARRCWQDDLYDEGLKLLETLPPEPEVDLTRGLIYLCQGRGEPGQALVEQALPNLAGPNLWKACYDLGVTYEFLGALPRALEHFNRAAAGWRSIAPKHPELANALFGLAGVQQKLVSADLPQTVAEFIQITDLEDPRLPVMAEAAVSVFIDFRQWTLVEDVLGELVKLRPRASYHYFLGQARYGQDKWGPALESFTLAKEAYRVEGNLLHQARCSWMVGRTLRQLQGEWRPHFAEAIARAQGDAKLLGEILADQDQPG